MSVLIHLDVVWGLVFIELETLSGLRWESAIHFSEFTSVISIQEQFGGEYKCQENFFGCQNSDLWNFKTAQFFTALDFHCWYLASLSISPLILLIGSPYISCSKISSLFAPFGILIHWNKQFKISS
jgi:hypothetical protein